MDEPIKVFKDIAKRPIRVEHNWTEKLLMPFYHSHSDYELLYIRRGRPSITSSTETVEIPAPAIVMHQPFVLHRACTDGEELYERYIVYFGKATLEKAAGWIPQLPGLLENAMLYAPLDAGLAERLDGRFEELIGNFWEGNTNRCELLLLLLLEEIFSALNPKSICTVQEKQSYIMRVLVYISENCEKDLNVEAIAGQFFVSRGKLAADFKNYTGMGVKQYILLARIHRAKGLLRQGGLSLSQIALQCGFCDNSHFINTFRRFEGITPGEFADSLERKKPSEPSNADDSGGTDVGG